MGQIDSVLRSYVLYRLQGLATLASLERLRPQIEVLDAKQKGRVVAAVRYYEKRAVHKVRPTQNKRQHIPQSTSAVDTTTVTVSVPYGDPTQQPNLCSQCSTLNWSGERLCRHCQTPLNGNGASANSRHMLTRRLDASETMRDDQFSPDSTLILRLPQHRDIIELAPQKFDRSLIFGRFDESGGIIPDVDFTDYDGATYGVSRLHMALTYNPRYHRLTIKDMGSVNGVTVNGQRLTSYESRTLHQGDRLELGRMIIQVIYVHD